jgi:hypothetical protein
VLKHARANEQGEFQFTELPAGEFHLSTSRDDYATERASLQLQANEARSLDLRLQKVQRVHGRVTDANRNPVAEARVQICYEQEPGFANRFQWEEGDASTDETGRFTLEVHPTRAYVVQVTRAGFLSAASAPQRAASEIALTLAHGVAFSGTLNDDAGHPLAHAQVQLTAERELVALNRFLPFELLQQLNQTTTTQADGTFEFANVTTAPHTLTVTHPQTEPKRMTINLRRAQKLDLTMTRKF